MGIDACNGVLLMRQSGDVEDVELRKPPHPRTMAPDEEEQEGRWLD